VDAIEIKGEVACQGGGNITGKARYIHSADSLPLLQEGEILVCDMTGPDWMPAFDKASAIITAQGGRLCHAAIIARQYNMPCIVGAGRAVLGIDGKDVLIDMLRGTITASDLDTNEGRSSAWSAAAAAGREVKTYDAHSLWNRDDDGGWL
jgi:pyruvate,water dikinase